MLVSSRGTILKVALVRFFDHHQRSKQSDARSERRDPTRSALIVLLPRRADSPSDLDFSDYENEWPRPESFA
jgi:hypothetical protein